MVFAFLAVAFSPVLLVLGTIQVVRRFAEYAIAKPSREMLFTVVDQESKYKAKNVIDTVVYRFGDVTSAWLSAAVLPSASPAWPSPVSSCPHAGSRSPTRSGSGTRTFAVASSSVRRRRGRGHAEVTSEETFVINTDPS